MTFVDGEVSLMEYGCDIGDMFPVHKCYLICQGRTGWKNTTVPEFEPTSSASEDELHQVAEALVEEVFTSAAAAEQQRRLEEVAETLVDDLISPLTVETASLHQAKAPAFKTVSEIEVSCFVLRYVSMFSELFCY